MEYLLLGSGIAVIFGHALVFPKVSNVTVCYSLMLRGIKGMVCAHAWDADKAIAAALRVKFQAARRVEWWPRALLEPDEVASDKQDRYVEHVGSP